MFGAVTENVVEFISKRETKGLFRSSIVEFSDKLLLNYAKRVLPVPPVSSRSVFILKANCDNKIIAAGNIDGVVVLYDAVLGGCIGQCEGHDRPAWSISFHPLVPHVLATGCLGGRVCVWRLDQDSLKTPKSDNIIKPFFQWQRSEAITSLAFHPSRSVIVVSWTYEIAFIDWDKKSMLSIWRYAFDISGVRWVHFSPDGSTLYTASSNPRLIENDYLGAPNVLISERSSSDDNNDKILRGELVHFLFGQPASWYEGLGICHFCYLRLCLWAAGLVADPSFPHQNFPPSDAVDRVLATVAEKFPNGPTIVSEAMELRQNDPSPGVVVVIEDLPSNEWLLGKACGSVYCTLENPPIMCCPGHTWDLFLTHRDLIRHSLCRRCLRGFWKWANDDGRVQWFTWTRANPNPNRAVVCISPRVPDAQAYRSARMCYRCCQKPQRRSTQEPLGSDASTKQLLALVEQAARGFLHGASTPTPAVEKSREIRCKRKFPGSDGEGRTSSSDYQQKQPFGGVSASHHFDNNLPLASNDKDLSNDDLVACCKCGGIVRQTVAVDEKMENELNVFCTHLLFPDRWANPAPFSFQQVANALANIFQAMGEYSSASTLRDATNRICRWELKSSPSGELQICNGSDTAPTCMTNNFIVTYRNNNIVVPHARIFNDSSISVSADGKFIAAVIVPPGNHGDPELFQEQDSVVAVYWAEPASRRGQCAFATSIVPNTEPVCLHFSPSTNFLVVGTANSPLASALEVPESVQRYNAMFAKLINYRPPAIAYVYAFSGRRKSPVEQSSRVKEVFRFDPNDPNDPSCNFTPVSLNTILWHYGGIAYATTKGEIVMLQPRSQTSVEDSSASNDF